MGNMIADGCQAAGQLTDGCGADPGCFGAEFGTALVKSTSDS